MRLRRIFTVTERVLRQLWHDRRVLAFMLIIPAVAMILFGYSFSGDITGIRTAFIDEDDTDLTASLLENLQANDAFRVTVLAPGEDPERLLLKEGYQAVIRIPDKFTSLYYAHFAMGVATSAQGTIDLTLDESDPQIASTVGIELADAIMDLGEGGPVDVEMRDLFGEAWPDFPASDFSQLRQPIDFLGTTRWSLPAVMLVEIWQWTPFVIITLLAGLRSVPEEPKEAALVDGATRWQSFIHVVVPHMRGQILIVLLIRSMDVFKTFDIVYALTFGGPGQSTTVATFYLYRQAFSFFRMGYASAIAWILFVVGLILAVAFFVFGRRSPPL